MKTVEICCSKTCVNFGRCYGNQGWAETVENQILFLKISSFDKSESFNSVAQGVLEIFWKVYLGGGGGTMCPPPPPPALNRVNECRTSKSLGSCLAKSCLMCCRRRFSAWASSTTEGNEANWHQASLDCPVLDLYSPLPHQVSSTNGLRQTFVNKPLSRYQGQRPLLSTISCISTSRQCFLLEPRSPAVECSNPWDTWNFISCSLQAAMPWHASAEFWTWTIHNTLLKCTWVWLVILSFEF